MTFEAGGLSAVLVSGCLRRWFDVGFDIGAVTAAEQVDYRSGFWVRSGRLFIRVRSR